MVGLFVPEMGSDEQVMLDFRLLCCVTALQTSAAMLKSWLLINCYK